MRRKLWKPGTIGLVIFLVASMAVLTTGVISATRSVVFFAKSVAVSGQVVSIEVGEVYSRSRRDMVADYRPVFSFFDESGIQHQAETRFKSTAYNYAIGDFIEIRYTPSEFSVVRVDRAISFWLAPGIMFVIGLKFLGLAYIKQHKRRVWKPKPNTSHPAKIAPQINKPTVARRR